MLKTLRILLDSTFYLVLAFYLGYVFSDVFLKAFLPDSMGLPCVLLSSAGFFLVLRWLKTESPSQQARSNNEQFKVAQSATVSKGSIRLKALSSYSHLLQARAVSELFDLLHQSQLPQRHTEGIVAHAATKLEGCTNPSLSKGETCLGKGHTKPGT